MKRVLEWMEKILILNGDRKKMMISPTMRNLFSTGFTMNFYILLLLFAKPFIDDSKLINDKLQKVDPEIITKKSELTNNLDILIES